ncbi:MAG TPA: hypothetical protein VKX49_04530 [Bryobacteraceae bacterium]|nr:hypothetical protein [Bryobacteraceae bacterium]
MQVMPNEMLKPEETRPGNSPSDSNMQALYLALNDAEAFERAVRKHVRNRLGSRGTQGNFSIGEGEASI